LTAALQFNTLAKGSIQVASDDGLSLVPYTGSDASEITINGEINKLASNIAIARNFAGVYWRSDYVQGLLLGEAGSEPLLRRRKLLRIPNQTLRRHSRRIAGFRPNS
jgi:hypothetical protein